MVALVFLLVLTMLGISSLSGNVMQERMTYSFGTTARTFQAADSAVREGEYWVSQQTTHIACGNGGPPTMNPASAQNYSTPAVTLANIYDPTWWTATNAISFQVVYPSYTSTTSTTRTSGNNNLAALNRGNTSGTWFTVECMSYNPFLSGGPSPLPSGFAFYYYRITGHSSSPTDFTTQPTTSTTQSVFAWPQS